MTWWRSPWGACRDCGGVLRPIGGGLVECDSCHETWRLPG